jgi:hypothetical protein
MVDLQITLKEVAVYKALRDNVIDAKAPIYPGCGPDVSPSEIFDDVTYVDPDEESIDALLESDHNAFPTGIEDYVRKDHDLLIIRSPNCSALDMLKTLKSGGYIISNNWLGHAGELNKLKDEVELIGVINTARDNTAHYSTDLKNLFEEIENIEEFARLRPNAFKHLLGEMDMIALNGPFNFDVKTDELTNEKYEEYKQFMNINKNPCKRIADKYIFRKK